MNIAFVIIAAVLFGLAAASVPTGKLSCGWAGVLTLTAGWLFAHL